MVRRQALTSPRRADGCWLARWPGEPSAAFAWRLAANRLRPTCLREMESVRPDKIAWSAADHVPIDDQPVRLRESNVEGLAPNPTLRRVPQWLAICLIAGVTTISSLVILGLSIAPGASIDDVLRALMQLNVGKTRALLQEASYGFLIQSVVVMLVASLIVGIRCSGAITSERERQTWEPLLLTPLTAKQIIFGKMWGIMAASYWYLLAYAAPAVTLSVLGGPLALAYTMVWLGATVLAMYFIGAAGLYCSVRAVTSWRSLLSTLGIGYLGGLSIYAVSSPLIFILAGLLILILFLTDKLAGTNLAARCTFNRDFYRVFAFASCMVLCLTSLLMARDFLKRAQRWVADRDRTRHSEDEPFYRRSRGIRRISR